MINVGLLYLFIHQKGSIQADVFLPVNANCCGSGSSVSHLDQTGAPSRASWIRRLRPSPELSTRASNGDIQPNTIRIANTDFRVDYILDIADEMQVPVLAIYPVGLSAAFRGESGGYINGSIANYSWKPEAIYQLLRVSAVCSSVDARRTIQQ